MIAHFSIPSRTPREAAMFFAAVIDGTVFDFPVVPGASIAVANDNSGLAVEVYPADFAHHPGTGTADPNFRPEGPMPLPWEDQIFAENGDPTHSGLHIAMSSNLSEQEIITRATALGWRTVVCDRAGVFGLVEVWIDNKFLVEVLVQRELERYQAFLTPDGCAQMFGPGALPEPI